MCFVADELFLGSLFLQSTVFVVLWFQDRHRRGKSMKIIQMQKTAQGPMISVQALCAYAFLQVIICKTHSDSSVTE